ncbi:hypothetical protein GA0061094_0574 [[Bacillus] enclensis]|uniref:Uncharacterized protein n=2 Tax=Rossellomorea TaxID=2837508 RepID=A0A1C3ZC49_9BACI|nr:hypothetical protein [[Bacillus] enclensis]MBH9964796.1 hypothetical protein [[Bacillus] enclensis]QTC43040.1 hypothetical protein I7V34_07305 [Bacillus sp. V3]SCB79959.1 hypothetical protein GA0061094_0574 [[Bacillus] enclensis]
MNRWYFPFLIGTIIFVVLSLIGKFEMAYIVTYSVGLTLGFFLMYWLNRKKRQNTD